MYVRTYVCMYAGGSLNITSYIPLSTAYAYSNKLHTEFLLVFPTQ